MENQNGYEVPFAFMYSKQYYHRKIFSFIWTMFEYLFLTAVVFKLFLLRHEWEMELLSPVFILVLIILLFVGCFECMDGWKEISEYSTQVAFFKMWEKEVGTCRISESGRHIRIAFDIEKVIGKRDISRFARFYYNPEYGIMKSFVIQVTATKKEQGKIQSVGIRIESGLDKAEIDFLRKKERKNS